MIGGRRTRVFMYEVAKYPERMQVAANKSDVRVVLEGRDANTKVVGQQAIVCI